MCHWVSLPTQSCWGLLVGKPKDRLLRVVFISLEQKLACTKCCYRHVDGILNFTTTVTLFFSVVFQLDLKGGDAKLPLNSPFLMCEI